MPAQKHSGSRCKSPKRWHKRAGQCRTPCKMIRGPGAPYVASRKAPHYSCVSKASKKARKKSRK
jgi:hypothetical protein